MKATKTALDVLPEVLRKAACNTNALRFLFGPAAEA